MKKIEININGKAYPCRLTMGAMLLFKQVTGREASAITQDAISDLIVFIWCCIKSACRHDKVEFGLSVDDFADGITPDEAETMFAVINDDGGKGADDEKKTKEEKK